MGFQRRSGQEDLSRRIRDALRSGRVLCAEAATGTGKTFAYLIGALEAQAENGLPIVISTATVALQEQIYRKDVPALVDAGLVSAGSFVLSKGRGRYFCPQMTRHGLTGSAAPVQLGLMDGFEDAEADAMREAETMLEAWDQGQWDGDRDSWKGRFPRKTWPLVQASRETCSGKRCPEFGDCPFYRDRMRLEKARIVVANHSLVLADLKMRAEGVEPLFPFVEYLLVFDEAHHLPDIARDSGAGIAAVSAAESTLGQVNTWLHQAQEAGHRITEAVTPRRDTAKYCLRLESLAEQSSITPENWLRFRQGTVPAPWKPLATDAAVACGAFLTALGEIQGKMKNRKDPATLTLLNRGRVLTGEVQRLHQGLVRFAGLDPALPACARWVERHPEDGYRFCATPLEGAGVLQALAWAGGVRVVLMSATLRALGGFEAFAESAGLPGDTRFEVVPPVLPYHRSQFHLPPLPASPGDSGYPDMLVSELSRRLDPAEGSLVLFTNDRLMRWVAEQLPEPLRKRCLVQGRGAAPALLQRHKERIEAGQGSVLFGLQTFSEGLDLPGNLCTHVILTRLPFAFPATPLEEARQEAIGASYFRKVALPGAARRLVQAAGRLVRRDTDRGRITCLDLRLRDTDYGRAMLKDLPPFEMIREDPEKLKPMPILGSGLL
ncbi:MAG: helicase C-terminal domain-containing protein [Thiomonas sp.]